LDEMASEIAKDVKIIFQMLTENETIGADSSTNSVSKEISPQTEQLKTRGKRVATNIALPKPMKELPKRATNGNVERSTSKGLNEALKNIHLSGIR